MGPQKRAVYDQYGADGLRGAPPPSPHGDKNGFPGGFCSFLGGPDGVRFVFSSGGPAMGMGGMSNSRANDIFRTFFGGEDGLSDFFGGMHLGGMAGRRGGPPMGNSKRKREWTDPLPEGAHVRLAGLDN